MTSFRSRAGRLSACEVTYSYQRRFPLGATEGSRRKPAKAGFFLAKEEPAFGRKSRLFPWPKESRLLPASAGSSLWRPKETGAGVSRREPAPFPAKGAGFWPKGAGFWPKEAGSFPVAPKEPA